MEIECEKNTRHTDAQTKIIIKAPYFALAEPKVDGVERCVREEKRAPRGRGFHRIWKLPGPSASSGFRCLRPPASGLRWHRIISFFLILSKNSPKIRTKFKRNFPKIHKNLSKNFPKIQNNFKIIQCKFTIFYANFPGLTNWDISDKWIKFNCFNPKIHQKIKKKSPKIRK